MEIIILIVIIAFYFLPSIVGWNKKNIGAILILNLFLGWTLIGWVIALVWACTVDNNEKIVYVKMKKNEEKSEKNYTREELQKILDNMPED